LLIKSQTQNQRIFINIFDKSLIIWAGEFNQIM
jgi:hypothetical protein